MTFFVYIIYSEKFDKYYVGQTNDFEARIKRHNDGYEGFTSPYRPWLKSMVLEKATWRKVWTLKKK